MLRKASFAAGFATFYLVVYIILLQPGATFNIAAYMFLVSPVAVVWMALTVIKYGKYSQRELNGVEFGYQDKNKNQLGMF